MLRRRMMLAQGGVSLPVGYTKIEYLESDGSAGIDTGYKPTEKTRLEFKASVDSNLFIACDVTNTSARYGVYFTNNKVDMGFGASGYKGSVISSISYPCEAVFENGKLTINDTTYTFATQSAFTSPSNLFIFGEDANTISKGKIYYLKIYENGVIIRNYIPCTNPVGVKGLWDKVNEEFYALTPTGYTRLAYLESNGSDYIDTGFKPNQDTRVVMDATALDSVSAFTAYFGVRENTYKQCISCFATGSSNPSSPVNNLYLNVGDLYSGDDAFININPFQRRTIDVNKNAVYVDGSVVHTFEARTFENTISLYLCASNDAETPSYLSKLRIYSCQIYDNGVLIRDFIPCTNPDGISGLWDSVNDVFYKMLPADYTRLDFIESDGTTYIDTGFKPNNNTRVVFEGYNNSTSSIWIFGAWKAKNDKMFAAAALNTYNICYGTEIWANATMPVGPISIDINKNAYTYNGVSGTLSEQTFSCDYPMYLFHINAAGTVSTGSFNGRIYSVKIYDNGTLVRDFIPAMNASGEAGLYDLKNDVWYALLPVAKPKVENKISTLVSDCEFVELKDPLTGEISIARRCYMRAQATYAVESDITIKYKLGSSPAVRDSIIAKGSKMSTSGPPFLAEGAIPVITSITPTEDDTYIYTF